MKVLSLGAICSFTVCLVISPAIGAVITPLAQSRMVNASAQTPSAPPAFQSASAVGFGPFDADVSAITGSLTAGTANVRAAQHSRILPDTVTTNGSLSGTLGGSAVWATQAVSNFDLDFSISGSTPFAMAASFSGSLANHAGYHLLLTDSSNQQLGVIAMEGTSGAPQFAGGTLGPGNYHLQAVVAHITQPNGNDGQTNMSYSWFFAVPTPSTAAILGLGSLIATRRRR
jgi:hypothetical protein